MFSKTKLVAITMLLVLFSYPLTMAFGGSSNQQINKREVYRNGGIISFGGPIAEYQSNGKEKIKDVSVRFGLDPWLVGEMNQLDPASQLVFGQKVMLPDDRVIIHTVLKDETVYRIAKLYGATIQRIIDENDLKDVYKLQIGTKLLVPVPLKSTVFKKQISRGAETSNKLFEWPTKGIFTSGFRWRWGRMHEGIDLADKIGTPIKAARSGIVTFAGPKGAYGNAVFIDHGNNVCTRYGHASKVLVKEGQFINQGETIALVGSTGRSTGPHVHFEIRIDDNPINPMRYLPSR